MKVAANQVTLLEARVLFAPLQKLKLVYGSNNNKTVCDLFTAAGYLVVKTNTGDFKAPADGELWPPAQLTMRRVKQLAAIYAKSRAPVRFERTAGGFKVDTTMFSL
jgi:hypothetical protein